ncbi:MAG: ester cyclase [Vicinamibacterales bacterium]
MTRAELQGLAQRYADAWQHREPAAIAQFYASNGVVESPIYATLHGRKAIADAARAFFSSFPDAVIAADAVIVDPPHAASFTTVNATHVNAFFGMPGTNRHIEFRSAQLLEMDGDGLIARERRIYDFTGLLLQVGILRAKPAKP